MQIIVHLTEEELNNISLDHSALTKIILKKVGSITKNQKRIFDQLEIELELKVDNISQAYIQKKNSSKE
jgi:hypothetical protein